MKQSKNFIKLQKKWYDKLKKSGFEDIEEASKETEFSDSTDRLKNWDSLWFARFYNESQDRYYTLAIDFATNYPFKTKLQHFIWEKHSEGLSVRDIETELAKKNIEYKKSSISSVVNKLAKIMLKKQII